MQCIIFINFIGHIIFMLLPQLCQTIIVSVLHRTSETQPSIFLAEGPQYLLVQWENILNENVAFGSIKADWILGLTELHSYNLHVIGKCIS